MTTKAATMLTTPTSNTCIKLNKPSLHRGRTTETSTTATWSHITDEDGSTSIYTISQYDNHETDMDDFVIRKLKTNDREDEGVGGDNDNEILYDSDHDSIEELISSTARRWKQETAHTVRHTATGVRFPCTASALQTQAQQLPPIQPAHYMVPPSEQLLQQQQQPHYYCYSTHSSSHLPIPNVISAVAPPPVTVLSIPHTSVDDDDLTVETAFLVPSSTRRPNYDDSPCLR